MKKLYICITFIFALNMTGAQNFNIGNESDNKCFSYTASGCQDVVNGNHSKAINESRKIANLVAHQIANRERDSPLLYNISLNVK